MTRTKIGAVSWILCFQYFVAEALSIHAWPGQYSLANNYISDLGATSCRPDTAALAGSAAGICSPLHSFFNASLQLQGFLILFGAAFVWRAIPKRPLCLIALLLVAASGIGVFLVGSFSEDSGSKLHILGAAENFICCNVGMIVMGFSMLREWRVAPPVVAITLLAGIVGLAGLVLVGEHVSLGLGVGGMERVTAYPFPIWLSGMGILLLTGLGLPREAGAPEAIGSKQQSPEPEIRY